VAALAERHPAIYSRYQLPPIRYADNTRPARKQLLGRLNDVRIARTYLGVAPAQATASDVARAVDHFGAPLGPALTMPDGAVRQAFEKVVYERPVASPDAVRLAPAGRALDEALHLVPASAAEPQAPPPLPVTTPVRRPSAVTPFLWSLAGLVLAYLTVVGISAGLRRRGRATGAPPDRPGGGPPEAAGRRRPVGAAPESAQMRHEWEGSSA
jgi:hypothetical protein